MRLTESALCNYVVFATEYLAEHLAEDAVVEGLGNNHYRTNGGYSIEVYAASPGRSLSQTIANDIGLIPDDNEPLPDLVWHFCAALGRCLRLRAIKGFAYTDGDVISLYMTR